MPTFFRSATRAGITKTISKTLRLEEINEGNSEALNILFLLADIIMNFLSIFMSSLVGPLLKLVKTSSCQGIVPNDD